MPLKTVRTGYLASVTLVTSGLGMFLVWLRQLNYGANISPDSTLYISLAESLAKGEGFRSWDGDASAANLFPVALSIIISLGVIDKLSAAVYLNIAAFGLSIFVLIVWLSFKTKSRFIILYIGTICAISPSLGHEHARILTEPLSTLLVVTSLFALDRFLDSTKEHWIILAAISASLEFLTHPIGTFLIIATLIILATCLPSSKIKYMAIYLSIVTPAVGVYLLNNLLRIGRLIRPQYDLPFNHLSSIDTLTYEAIEWMFGILSDYLETISETFGINNILVRVVILVVLVALGSLGLRLQNKRGSIEFRRLDILLVFILIYIFCMYISLAISGRSGPVRARYLIPIYTPYLVIIAVILDRILSNWRKVYIIPVAGFMGLLLISNAIISYNDIKEWQNHGFGYLSEDWIDSETIDYLNSDPVTGLIYSNQIRAVYINSRLSDSDETYFRQLPSQLSRNDFTLTITDDTQNIDLQNIDMYVVWFSDGKAYKSVPLDYDLTSLVASQNLEVIAILEDGIVFRRNQGLSLYFEDLEAAILEAILKDAWLIFSQHYVDLYFDGERLTYVSTKCDGMDVGGRFFLHVYPGGRADKNSDLDFNNYDFSFSHERILWGESCAAIRNLPDYDIKMIRTGQFIAREGQTWVEEFRPDHFTDKEPRDNVK